MLLSRPETGIKLSPTFDSLPQHDGNHLQKIDWVAVLICRVLLPDVLHCKANSVIQPRYKQALNKETSKLYNAGGELVKTLTNPYDQESVSYEVSCSK